MGSGFLPLNTQARLRHVSWRFFGSSAFGTSLNEVGSSLVPHHGQLSSGIGETLVVPRWYRPVLARAVVLSFSPFSPIRLGVAAFPTHNPISKGHVPSVSVVSWRSNSSAQMSVDARLN